MSAWNPRRRTFLRTGLAAFASAVSTRALGACGPSSSGALDGGALDGSALDGATLDDASVEASAPRDAVADAFVPSDFELVRRLPPPPRLRSLLADIGPLGAPDANGLRLPPGFRGRVLARSNEVVPGTSYEWHLMPDGGATFATEDGGWIYVSNCEMLLNFGGVSALRFGPDGALRAAYPILQRTNVNCAGGPTPWHTWLSCEEQTRGQVFECDPWGERRAEPRPALGVFKHEAATVDRARGHVYLTEDETDGRFYRFVAARRTRGGEPSLLEGALEVAVVAADGAVSWRAVPDPQFRGEVPTRLQVAEATVFNGGEGVWFHEDTVFFTTKGTEQLWAYDVRASRLRVVYDANAVSDPPLRGVDNITVTCCGDVVVAEDGGSMQLVAVLPSGVLKPLVQVVGHDGSELAGPAFDPSGTRLYFSSQRVPGTTFEITGPFHAPLA